MICRSGGRVVWCISPIICLRISVNAGWRGGDGGDEKRSSPHSHSVREAGRRSREEVCVCVCVRERERERERERQGQHVGKREFTFKEGICLGYYCNRV